MRSFSPWKTKTNPIAIRLYRMNGTADELAGVVDLFGGLTRTELARALAETAYRADGQRVDEDAVDEALEMALGSFALVRYDPSADVSETGADERSGSSLELDVESPLFVAGPTAFPRTPEYAEDLPHILDIERRYLDRNQLARAARNRFEVELGTATREESTERLEELLEVSYDLETWGPIDLSAERELIGSVLDGNLDTDERDGSVTRPD